MHTIRFCQHVPDDWLPSGGESLIVSSVTLEHVKDLVEVCEGKSPISHIRSEVLCQKVNQDLGLFLGITDDIPPAPFDCEDVFVMVTIAAYTSTISYLVAWDGTKTLEKAELVL